MSPAEVSTASPRPIGARSSDWRWIASPPAVAIARATPPPCFRSVLAAFAIASTSSFVTSALRTSISGAGIASALAAPRARLEFLDTLGGLRLGERVVEGLAGLLAERAQVGGLGAGHRLVAGDPFVGRLLGRGRWCGSV